MHRVCQRAQVEAVPLQESGPVLHQLILRQARVLLQALEVVTLQVTRG